jgi:hypothetical protein
MALVFLCIGVSLKVSETQTSAIRHNKFFFLFIPFSSEFEAEEFSPSDGFGELGKPPPDEEADGIFPVLVGMGNPISD